MKPVCYDIHVYQGASWVLEATFREPPAEDGTPGALLDLTNHDGELAIRRVLQDDEVIISLTQSGGGIVFNPSAPNIILRMTDEETSSLPTHNVPVEDWVYEFRMFETGNEDYTTVRLLEGRVYIYPAVIR